MNINKFQLNHVLLLFLITAFLTMGWTTAHIHLPEQHNHDGVYHQHQVKTHAHNLTNQYIADIDFSHQASHINVIELDYKYNLLKRETHKSHSTAIVLTASHPPPSFLLVSIKIPVATDIKLSYFNRSTLGSRAPPQTS